MWMILLLACDAPTHPLVLDRLQPQPVRDVVLGPEGDFVLATQDDNGDPKLAVIGRTSAATITQFEGGPGGPIVGDGRVYTLLDNGVRAYRGLATDWTYTVPGLVPNDHQAALGQDGTIHFATRDNGEGHLYAVAHLGFLRWETMLQSPPRGPMVVDGDNRLYVRGEGTLGPRFYVIDANDGRIVDVQDLDATPVAALESGVLVKVGTTLQRLDGQGLWVWTVDADVSTVVYTDPARAFLTLPTEVMVIDLATGFPSTLLDVSCGPLALEETGKAYGLCARSEEPTITRLYELDTFIGAGSGPLGQGTPIASPVITNSRVHSVFNRPASSFVAHGNVLAPATSGWPRAGGDLGNARRYTP